MYTKCTKHSPLGPLTARTRKGLCAWSSNNSGHMFAVYSLFTSPTQNIIISSQTHRWYATRLHINSRVAAMRSLFFYSVKGVYYVPNVYIIALRTKAIRTWATAVERIAFLQTNFECVAHILRSSTAMYLLGVGINTYIYWDKDKAYVFLGNIACLGGGRKGFMDGCLGI